MRFAISSIVGLCLVGAMACSEESGTAAPAPPFIRPPTPTESTPAEIVITPSLDTLRAIGETGMLGAIVVGSDGSVIAGVSVTWSSLAPGIVGVGVTSGTVTALAVGTATIQASAGPVTSSATILVLDSSP